MIYDKRSFETMKYIEETLQSPITGIKTDDFEAMEKVGCLRGSKRAVVNDSTDRLACSTRPAVHRRSRLP